MTRWDGPRVVVEVPPPVRPVNVVEHYERERLRQFRGAFFDEPKLVKHRVPVVVTVDEYGLEASDQRYGIETQGLVKDCVFSVPLLPF